MEDFNVYLEARTPAGKGPLKRLRDEGLIPGVLYDNGNSTPVSLKLDEIKHLISRHGENFVLNLNFNGARIKARIKELQKDPATGELMHVDLIPVGNNILH